MEAWVVVLIVAVIVIVAVVAYVGAQKRRREALKGRFGPEYDRTVSEAGDRKEAERELKEREERRAKLDIRPLEPAERERYLGSWQQTQARFVDEPQSAVREADALVMLVMRDRGYPVDDFDQRSADISVDHPRVVENYRAAHGISMANDRGEATTEDLRQAMVHYRELFEELLGSESRATGAGADGGREEERRPAR
jgi:hypothetical protein